MSSCAVQKLCGTGVKWQKIWKDKHFISQHLYFFDASFGGSGYNSGNQLLLNLLLQLLDLRPHVQHLKPLELDTVGVADGTPTVPQP